MSLTKEAIGGALNGAIQTIVGHPFDTLKTLTQKNGKLFLTTDPKILFRGWQYPIITKATLSSIRFTGTKYYGDMFNNYWIGGSITGVLTSPIVSILDFYKTQKQNNIKIDFFKMNPLRGVHVTATREFFGMGSFFGLYHYFKDNNISSFNSGGLAGTLCWLGIYPFDTIKTRVQTEKISVANAIKKGNFYKGIMYQLTKIYIATGTGFMVSNFLLNNLLN